MTSVRSIFVFAHRWVGLLSSVVLVIAGLTGAMIVWPGDFPGRKILSALHDSLLLGRRGRLIVVVFTMAGVALLLSGLYLWWRSKLLRVRTKSGLRPFLIDLHYSFGALGLIVMLVIGGSAVVRGFVKEPATRKLVTEIHTGEAYSSPMKAIYMLGSFGFVVQGLTGVVMWWRPARSRRRSSSDPTLPAVVRDGDMFIDDVSTER